MVNFDPTHFKHHINLAVDFITKPFHRDFRLAERLSHILTDKATSDDQGIRDNGVEEVEKVFGYKFAKSVYFPLCSAVELAKQGGDFRDLEKHLQEAKRNISDIYAHDGTKSETLLDTGIRAVYEIAKKHLTVDTYASRDEIFYCQLKSQYAKLMASTEMCSLKESEEVAKVCNLMTLMMKPGFKYDANFNVAAENFPLIENQVNLLKIANLLRDPEISEYDVKNLIRQFSHYFALELESRFPTTTYNRSYLERITGNPVDFNPFKMMLSVLQIGQIDATTSGKHFDPDTVEVIRTYCDELMAQARECAATRETKYLKYFLQEAQKLSVAIGINPDSQNEEITNIYTDAINAHLEEANKNASQGYSPKVSIDEARKFVSLSNISDATFLEREIEISRLGINQILTSLRKESPYYDAQIILHNSGRIPFNKLSDVRHLESMADLSMEEKANLENSIFEVVEQYLRHIEETRLLVNIQDRDKYIGYFRQYGLPLMNDPANRDNVCRIIGDIYRSSIDKLFEKAFSESPEHLKDALKSIDDIKQTLKHANIREEEVTEIKNRINNFYEEVISQRFKTASDLLNASSDDQSPAPTRSINNYMMDIDALVLAFNPKEERMGQITEKGKLVYKLLLERQLEDLRASASDVTCFNLLQRQTEPIFYSAEKSGTSIQELQPYIRSIIHMAQDTLEVYKRSNVVWIRKPENPDNDKEVLQIFSKATIPERSAQFQQAQESLNSEIEFCKSKGLLEEG